VAGGRIPGNRQVFRDPGRLARHAPERPLGPGRTLAAYRDEPTSAPNPQPDGTLVKALARAWRWQRMLDEGRFASVRELAEAERAGHSYVRRILRLTLLAPTLWNASLTGARHHSWRN